ncbi:MAG: hypothetical protein DDT41_01814 [candidate division WS2 bacterium]|nr:hypothetical protein [Candidatus Psychracetigena formicireducens]
MPYQKYDVWHPNYSKNCYDGQVNSFKQAPFSSKACARVEGGTTGDCVNFSTAINPLLTGAVAKIPVVLAELTVQISVNSIIDLPEYACEIKNIKKHLKITQCLLLQDTNVLFIKGFVRKNIDYTTRSCSNYQGVCGDIKHCTVDVPFSCTTPVLQIRTD